MASRKRPVPAHLVAQKGRFVPAVDVANPNWVNYCLLRWSSAAPAVAVRSQVQEIFRHDAGYRVTMCQNTANPLIRDRVNTMNNVLKSVSGLRNALIHPNCKELIKDLRQVRWRRDSAGNPTGDLDKSDPQRTHVSDALSYLVAQEWGLRPQAGAMKGIAQ